MTPTVTQGHCPTPQNSPTYIAMNAAATPARPHQTGIQGILPDKKKSTPQMAHMLEETTTLGSL